MTWACLRPSVRSMWIWAALVAAIVVGIVVLLRSQKPRGRPEPWNDEDVVQPGVPDVGQPLIEIGYWPTSIDRDRPDPSRFVDPSWSRREREAVVEYLAAGSELRWDGGLVEFCSFCGAVLVVDELTDGVYVWPTYLIHSVDEHEVRVPNSFVAHVQRASSGKEPSDAGTVDYDARSHTAEWWNAL